MQRTAQVSQAGSVAELERVVPGAAVYFKDLVFEDIELVFGTARKQALNVHELKHINIHPGSICIGIPC